MNLIELLLTYAPQTAVLGLNASGATVPFTLPDNGHVLISGQSGSGKTSLLQTVAVTLALAQPSQFVIIQGRGSDELNALNHLPSAYRFAPVLTDHTQAAQTLAGLAGGRRSSRLPLVVLIDDVESLWDKGKTAVLLPLLPLLQQSQLHLVFTTAEPENDLLGYLAELFTMRLVGKTAASPHPQAQHLLGQGDFLLFGSHPAPGYYFQSAYADRYDVSFLLNQLPAPAIPAPLTGWKNGRLPLPALPNI